MCRSIGPGHRTIWALRFPSSGAARAEGRSLKKLSQPVARRSRNEPASVSRSIGPGPRTISALRCEPSAADTGSIAIGGSVTGCTVIIGIPQEKVDELVRDAKRPLEELTPQQRENIA